MGLVGRRSRAEHFQCESVRAPQAMLKKKRSKQAASRRDLPGALFWDTVVSWRILDLSVTSTVVVFATTEAFFLTTQYILQYCMLCCSGRWNFSEE